uniref:ANK_REP_REGION domain-containing protein n=1 Tax=Haemonchus placei TaxID=6290 RepID=A0A0N4W5Y4_HAEPC
LLSIQKRTNVDENEHGTALHRAVQMGNAVMAKSLLGNKSVWIDEEDGRGRTALHYSMEQDSFEVVEVLVTGGANLDCVDFHGTSACHLACKEGRIDAVGSFSCASRINKISVLLHHAFDIHPESTGIRSSDP